MDSLKRQKENYRFSVAALISTLFTLVAFTPLVTQAFTGGDGSSGSPYQIATCQHLQDMQNDLNAYYVLADNVDCTVSSTWNSGAGFNPIGEQGAAFEGELDGDGHSVTNLTINRPDENDVALFGAVTDDAKIIDFGLDNVTVHGEYVVGGMVGALTGYAEIQRSFVTGNITGDLEFIGGMAGYFGGNALISNSYTRVNVESTYVGATYSLGGMTGNTTHSTQIVNSYAAGTVEYLPGDPTIAGGFAGSLGNSVTITRSYWDSELEGSGPDNDIGTNLTSAQMKDIGTYLSSTGGTPWNFTTVWSMSSIFNNGYPALRWQGYDHDFSSPEVDTVAASAITDVAATLNATITRAINPDMVVERGFEWGTTGAYGQVITATSSDFDLGAYTGTLSGLACGTTYHFRAYAVSEEPVNDDQFTGYGDAMTFTTTACPIVEEESSGGGGGSRTVRSTNKTPSAVSPSKQTTSSGFSAAAQAIILEHKAIFIAAQAAGIVLPSEIVALLSSASAGSGSSVRDLNLGMSGDDVKSLQILLMAQGHSIPAGATGFFGSQTQDALIKYQVEHGIMPAAGYFGSVTRTVMKSKRLGGLWW